MRPVDPSLRGALQYPPVQRQALLKLSGSEPEDEVALLTDLCDDDAGALSPNLRPTLGDLIKKVAKGRIEVLLKSLF